MFNPTSVGSASFDQFLAMLEFMKNPAAVEGGLKEFRDAIQRLEEEQKKGAEVEAKAKRAAHEIVEEMKKMEAAKRKLENDKEAFAAQMITERRELDKAIEQRTRDSHLEAKATRDKAEAEYSEMQRLLPPLREEMEALKKEIAENQRKVEEGRKALKELRSLVEA